MGFFEKLFINKSEKYFREELSGCDLIKNECHGIVLQHLMKKKTNLEKTGNKLSAKEKKELGINPRIQITHEVVAVLTEKGLARGHPAEILDSLYYRATFAQSRDEQIKQYKATGVRKIQLTACCDERDCNWCQSMDGKKLSVSIDLNRLIKENCTCDTHSRLVVVAPPA